MDKVLKRKIRRLWHHRLLLGAGTLALIGYSLLQLQALLEHRPRQPSWVLELSNSVELLANQNSPANTRKQALSEIQAIAQARNLLVTATVARELEQEQEQEQTLERTLERTLELARAQALILERTLDLILTHEQEQEHPLERERARAQVLMLERELERARAQVLMLERELMLEQEQEQEQKQERVLTHPQALELEQTLARAQAQAQAMGRVWPASRENLVISVTAELESVHGLTIQHGETLDSLLNNEPRRTRMFLQAGVLLGLSGVTLMVFLGMLIRLNGRYTFPATTHFIAFLPEECVAELDVLQKRMKKANASLWQIRLRLLEEFVTLLWVFYIQVQLENLTLPHRNREIDD